MSLRSDVAFQFSLYSAETTFGRRKERKRKVNSEKRGYHGSMSLGTKLVSYINSCLCIALIVLLEDKYNISTYALVEVVISLLV